MITIETGQMSIFYLGLGCVTQVIQLILYCQAMG